MNIEMESVSNGRQKNHKSLFAGGETHQQVLIYLLTVASFD